MKIGLACRYQFTKKNETEPTQVRSLVHSDLLLSIMNEVEIMQVEPPGKGTIDSPYRPSQIGHWFYLANLDVQPAPQFILCGGCTIARWGLGAGGLQNYCTDVTSILERVRKACIGVENYHGFVYDLGTQYRDSDDLLGIDNTLPSYTRKALRLRDIDDYTAAATCRNLLGGAEIDCTGCSELVSTLCALFISEANRCKWTFVISLMLLDLIETRTTYGKGGLKHYTWKSMLMYHPSDEKTPVIIGRGKGYKRLGKHPMTGEGTVNLAMDLENYKGDNMVRDRIVSIMAVWLGHYMAKTHTQYNYFIVDEKKWSGVKAKVDLPNRTLKNFCADGVRQRAQKLDCMIGGTTISYENLLGQQV